MIQAKMQGGQAGGSAAEHGTVPPIVHEVLNSHGQPLHPSTRQFMEPAYGQNFSKVQVHADERAAQSADAVGALAYTLGEHVVFGSDTYRPDTTDGRQLIAHELAHVVQQHNAGPSPHTTLEIGNPHDSAEQEAEAAAYSAIASADSQGASAPRFTAQPSAHPTAQPVLRRAPAPKDKKKKTLPPPPDTWAGTFSVDSYQLRPPVRKKGVSNYGVNILIRFHPNPFVFIHASEIAFVQTAQSLINGEPQFIRDSEDAPTTKNRSSDQYSGSNNLGVHIDATPSSTTPLAGMRSPAGKRKDLSDSVVGNEARNRLGWSDQDSKPDSGDATFFDPPGLDVADNQEASQVLETAALIVAGPQEGAYLGSVSWGWTKKAGAAVATMLPFKLLSKFTPSQDFQDAADRWNSSTTDEDTPRPVMFLPVPKDKYTKVDNADLLDEPLRAAPIDNLPINTHLQVNDQPDPTKKDLRHAVVVEGLLTGSVGWVKEQILSDSPTDTKKKK